MTPNLGFFADGGFVGHNHGPHIDEPREWMVWHFTRLEYLPEIIESGRLVCDENVVPREGSVASPEVKAIRRRREITAAGYAAHRRVSQHVPFYFAAKSPMLFYVSRNYPQEILDSLVFFGVRVGDIIGLGLEWVASNGNAATLLTQFSADVDTLGTFVDFELLTAKYWNDTADDPARKSRRAAEILVYESVPLEAVSLVAVSNAMTLERASELLSGAGYENIEYRETTAFSY